MDADLNRALGRLGVAEGGAGAGAGAGAPVAPPPVAGPPVPIRERKSDNLGVYVFTTHPELVKDAYAECFRKWQKKIATDTPGASEVAHRISSLKADVAKLNKAHSDLEALVTDRDYGALFVALLTALKDRRQVAQLWEHFATFKTALEIKLDRETDNLGVEGRLDAYLEYRDVLREQAKAKKASKSRGHHKTHADAPPEVLNVEDMSDIDSDDEDVVIQRPKRLRDF